MAELSRVGPGALLGGFQIIQVIGHGQNLEETSESIQDKYADVNCIQLNNIQ